MAEIVTQSPIRSEAPDGIAAAALRAEAWAGEPFLQPDEDPAVALAPGTASRRALDEAVPERESGRRDPSAEWKVRYALMLGLERVLSEKPPHLASGTELRRHQVDALAGMLTELIAGHQKAAENGNGVPATDEIVEEDEEFEDDLPAFGPEGDSPGLEDDAEDEEIPELGPGEDLGAIRRYRFRHPTASGKTIAAAGFVEAARTEGVLILTHRRLLVDQFRRELTEHGYGGRPAAILVEGVRPISPDPITIQTYAWFARHVDEISRTAYQLVICDEAHTALGEKTSAAIRRFHEPIYIGMTATEQLIAKQVSDVFPASVDDLPLADAARRGLIAQLREEGWNSPRATVCMHLAPTASKRVYQQRIGRIMRIHPRKEAGIVVDFVPKGATHNERVVSLHSLLDADFYREGARVTPAPRRRMQRRARRKLTPAPWLVPVTPDVARRLAVIQREWQRVDPKYLDEDEQRFWATIAGRQMRFDERATFVQKFTGKDSSKVALETFLSTCAAQNPNRRLPLLPLGDRVSMRVDRADFDDLVMLVTQAPPWDKDRAAGVRIMLRAIAESKADAPDQILTRWTWKLAHAVRKTLDRKASQEYPDAKRLLGALANSRRHRHEENAARLG